jgi:menaquinone reductase, multiheme cytochrome c subunit
MAVDGEKKRFLFPRWANYVVPGVLLAIGASLPYNLLLVGYALNPTTLNVGYQPAQPVAYSHELHAGQLGIDCRYCHTTVEKAAFAAIPPTQTCMNCHFAVKASAKPGSEEEIAKIIRAYDTGEPLRWKKVHDLPDFAFFNHSIHVNSGVSCVECHGRVDRMDGDRSRVSIQKPLSMGWCLECHRKPEPNLRPVDQVFNLAWGTNLTEGQAGELRQLVEGLDVKAGEDLTEAQRQQIGQALAGRQIGHHKIDFLREIGLRTDCSACHR